MQAQYHPWQRFSKLSVLSLVTLALWTNATAVHAKKPENVTDGEIALLPEYCIDTEAFKYGSEFAKNRSPRASHWEQMMGKGFWSLHHYCWGLVELRRVKIAGRSAPYYKVRLGQIIDEFRYVLRNTNPGFILLPEIWTRMGDVWVLSETFASAREAYATARALKPDYWPAYTQWIEVLLKLNLRKEAESLTREGLRFAPDARPLLELARRLNIQPEPRTESAPPAAADAASSAASAAPPEPAAASKAQ